MDRQISWLRPLEDFVHKIGHAAIHLWEVQPVADQAARFDEQIERDAKAGKLDRLAEQAIADYRAGRAREL